MRSNTRAQPPAARPPGCSAHRALIAAVLDGTPSDGDLERYAEEIPACEACQRELARSLGVHPGRLKQPPDGGRQPKGPDLEGMEALQRALTPHRSLPVALAAGLALALAAAALLVAQSLSAPPPREASVALESELVPVQPAPEPREALVVAPPSQSSPEPKRERLPPKAPAQAPEILPEGDAVALADDWPPPPFEDLRSGNTKSSAPSIRALQLVLVGQPGYVVGEGVDLVIVSSHDTPVTVCVSGPERGTIWRGAIPAGRTPLTRGGLKQSFAFSAPGTYRFSLTSEGAERCSAPLHVVEVEVAR